jgi:hypothetical protein
MKGGFMNAAAERLAEVVRGIDGLSVDVFEREWRKRA